MGKAKRHEVYPHAPLEFVAFEIRYPLAPALVQESMLPQLQKTFYDWLPLVEPLATVEAEVQSLTGGTSTVPLSGPPSLGIRFLARDRHMAVSVTRNKLTVETTTYPGYGDFREVIRRALNAVEQLDAGIPGLSRIGLRYIDEIRVARRIAKTSDWSGYIDSRLIAPLGVGNESVTPDLYQALVQFDLGKARRAVMRFGAMQGQAVGNAPLRRRAGPASGPFFLIDVDGFWTSGDAVPEFSIDRVLSECDSLHDPVHELFEVALTERLRREILRSKKRGN